jgi:hypothetical protein
MAFFLTFSRYHQIQGDILAEKLATGPNYPGESLALDPWTEHGGGKHHNPFTYVPLLSQLFSESFIKTELFRQDTGHHVGKTLFRHNSAQVNEIFFSVGENVVCSQKRSSIQDKTGPRLPAFAPLGGIDALKDRVWQP